MRRVLPLLFLVAVVLATAAGCSNPATGHPAAKTIDKLLDLRRDDVRDPKAYAPYFLESSLATALAESSAETTKAPRVPEWQKPYVSEESSSGVSVVVVWKHDRKFPGWPKANIFMLTEKDGRWVVLDATETSSAPAPIKRSTQK